MLEGLASGPGTASRSTAPRKQNTKTWAIEMMCHAPPASEQLLMIHDAPPQCCLLMLPRCCLQMILIVLLPDAPHCCPSCPKSAAPHEAAS